MDKKRILFVGIGACGAKIVDEIRERDPRYATLYINTSIKDVEPRKYAKLDSNVYCIPSADGTGKDRGKAQNYAKDYYVSIIDTIKRYKTHNVIYLVTSCGGGSGSGLTPMIAKMLKKTCPDKSINLVAVKSSSHDTKRAIENNIEFWNDMLKVDKDVDSKIYLDNEKDTEDEINKRFAKDIDDAISLSSGNTSNVIDESDLTNVMTAKGGLSILRLDPNNSSNAEFAIQKAMKDGIYVEPVEEDCKFLCVSLRNESFNAKEIQEQFYVEEDTFMNTNTRDNLVIVSGINLPKLMIEMLNEELKDRSNQASQRKKRRLEENSDLTIKIAKDDKNKSTNQASAKEEVSSGKSSEIEDLLGDGFFDEFF